MPWNEPGSGDKDPWGNRNRGNNQAPDLEKVIDNVRKKFGGGNNTGGSMKFGGFSPIFLGLFIALIFWATRSFYQVDEGYQSIELRFGKYSQTVAAGLQFIFWPIEEKIIINSDNVRTLEVGFRKDTDTRRGSIREEAEMLTTDGNIADVSLAVQYNIPDVKELLFNVGRVEFRGTMDRVVRGATESALREVVGSTTMDDLFNKGRGVVETRTKEILQKILDRYQTGINVIAIEMQAAVPPDEVREAFDNVNKADQRREQLIKEAKAYEEKIVLRAEGTAARLVAEANGYKEAVIARSKGEAERFTQVLTEYEKAPAVTRKRLYIETMEEVLSNTNKVMIDQKGGNNMMYLPLDQIIKNSQRVNTPAPTKKNSNAPLPTQNDRGTSSRQGR